LKKHTGARSKMILDERVTELKQPPARVSNVKQILNFLGDN